jgi:hypothetical protein
MQKAEPMSQLQRAAVIRAAGIMVPLRTCLSATATAHLPVAALPDMAATGRSSGSTVAVALRERTASRCHSEVPTRTHWRTGAAMPACQCERLPVCPTGASVPVCRCVRTSYTLALARWHTLASVFESSARHGVRLGRSATRYRDTTGTVTAQWHHSLSATPRCDTTVRPGVRYRDTRVTALAQHSGTQCDTTA